MTDDPKKPKQQGNKETRRVRLTIFSDVANEEEAAQVMNWISDFVDEAKKTFPFKDRVKAVAEQIFSKPKNSWGK